MRAALAALLLSIAPAAHAASGVRFEVSYPASLEKGRSTAGCCWSSPRPTS